MVILSNKRSPNLLSYKYHIRPEARRLYGNQDSKSKHQQNVQKILKILALEGPLSTWEMAKKKFGNELDVMRTKEKEFRRLLIGRKDRGKQSPGILDLNLVTVENNEDVRGKKYRLTIFGILYCLDSIDFEKKEINNIAKNYSELLPKVFGKWEFLKSNLGDNVYNISLLGKGLLFDNQNIIEVKNEQFFELISFFNIKTNMMTTSVTEKEVGEFVSLWFFISLLYFPNLVENKSKQSFRYLNKIFKKDNEFKKWFLDFINEAREFYSQRSKILGKIQIE